MKKYKKPTITTISLDNKTNLIMNTEWQPGDGKPPWAGNPNKTKSENFEKDDNSFNKSPFKENPFDYER
jgi:hypothetical protein